ncbi:Phosphate acetyltransferase [Gluconacetobacter sp. SXCC-1]|uniref:Bifunctional enoyl-CoA hydratase/phosphate acetyltransferase n=1 Tax=Komagataeibacter rhaeticus TaxID=215221 RepID=A0A858JFE9_9PROT|nr:bifunctional enoyl-CoA hydratase/phosphate acetyltransferase [Komagataeibacter rhaeticus]ATU73498.1 phosphate acetyltransferase [Komagataeibacter xylinus]EGG75903.1 Phosphate acetyltransferase [Gluconacetobacter sp. SXCC-1]QIP34670.1 bifunctional enoyl-CoA hydratase/phosphate acetyltransferase [Komagataeibacter rhaeticus]QOC47194.1 bifunctional enoyl-CoA hydratase/phosphate acetyltransferase [Komagataeibacter rhaeticus]WPP20467.1 bifunctional enoyl-CoA hydratase/phosphate acetyltransferase 
MMRSLRFFDDLAHGLANRPPITLGVVYPCSLPALHAVAGIVRQGLAVPFLIGPVAEIRQLAASASISLEGCQMVDVPTPQEAARTGVAMAHEGRIAALMKGSLHSRIFLHELGHHEGGLRTARRMSHVYVLDAPQAPRVLLVSDGAVNIAPDLGTRCDIVQNSIDLAHMLGIGRPRVALLSAVEVVNPDLPSTLDAAVMCKMAERGQITGGVVDGPLALDNAISPEAARCKGVTSPVAGLADILVVPDLEAGNILAKQMTFIGQARAAGIVMGMRVPVILTSRADPVPVRVLSCMVAAAMIGQGYGGNPVAPVAPRG